MGSMSVYRSSKQGRSASWAATIAGLIGLMLLTGCVATPNLPPLTFSFPASRDDTKGAIIAAFSQRGYQITRDSQFQLVMDRPIRGNIGASLVFGSQFNAVPNARASMTVLGDNPVTVTVNLSVVTNPGSGFEQVTPADNNMDGRAQVGMMMQTAQNLLRSTGS